MAVLGYLMECRERYYLTEEGLSVGLSHQPIFFLFFASGSSFGGSGGFAVDTSTFLACNQSVV